MRYLKYDVRNENSLDDAALYLYLLDDSPAIDIHKRPLILICPGGGYIYTSDREAEIVAMQFFAMGYHAAVLRYSVAPAIYPTALLEVGRSVSVIREHAEEWFVDSDKIVLLGFSAGGHLAASFGVFWHEDFISEALGIEKELLRPDAMILGYPVITAGKYASRASFKHLLGDEYREKMADLSLENHVNEYTPKAFIWHTFEDSGVLLQNSLLFVNALVEHGIPVEYHIFEKGEHGLSLANRLTGTKGHGVERAAEVWIDLAQRFMENWITEKKE